MAQHAEQLIPRVIHRVWLGPNPIPALLERYADTWRLHHPTWEMRLWRDDTLPPLACHAHYDNERNWKARYDMVRLEIVRQFGGVIIDMDMEALRPLDPLVRGVGAFVGRYGQGRKVGIPILGAVQHHPFLEYAITQLDTSVGAKSSPRAGNGFISRLIAERPDGVTIFPWETFYSPLTLLAPESPDDFPEIYAVHHHLESYREGLEGEIFRSQKRLREAQVLIHRLLSKQGRADALLKKADAQLKKMERQLTALREKVAREDGAP